MKPRGLQSSAHRLVLQVAKSHDRKRWWRDVPVVAQGRFSWMNIILGFQYLNFTQRGFIDFKPLDIVVPRNSQQCSNDTLEGGRALMDNAASRKRKARITRRRVRGVLGFHI